MSVTKGGKAHYMHPLPADITDVNCKAGEVSASVFERYRLATYHEAQHKPYVIAAMILLTRFGEAGEGADEEPGSGFAASGSVGGATRIAGISQGVGWATPDRCHRSLGKPRACIRTWKWRRL